MTLNNQSNRSSKPKLARRLNGAVRNNTTISSIFYPVRRSSSRASSAPESNSPESNSSESDSPDVASRKEPTLAEPVAPNSLGRFPWLEPSPSPPARLSWLDPGVLFKDISNGNLGAFTDLDDELPQPVPLPVGDPSSHPIRAVEHGSTDKVMAREPQVVNRRSVSTSSPNVFPLPDSKASQSESLGNYLARSHTHVAQPIRSTHKVISAATGPSPCHIDESEPLLGTSKVLSYLQPHSPTPTCNLNVNASPTNFFISDSWYPRSSVALPQLRDLGWVEYRLPDKTFYYVHPTRRVTTDANLRNENVLNLVTAYLENIEENVSSGCELWLRDVGNPGKGFIPSRNWVNHQLKSVVVDIGSAEGKKQKAPEEDPLDLEYRYWSFIEGHPAHMTLPPNAKSEAFEVLNWAWTDQLVPSNQGVPAAFSPYECQDLKNLLLSFTPDQDSIQARLIARMLMRVAIWHQAYFRPYKPLPKDVTTVRQYLPIHQTDEKFILRIPGSMRFIGICGTCNVVAIALSASVTLFSFPCPEIWARIVGLVATLLASFSMAAILVAISRYNTDVERSVPQIGVGII